MKNSKIFMAALLVLAFNSTVYADKFKFQICKDAETSFWNTLHATYDDSEKAIVKGLKPKAKKIYFETALADIQTSFADLQMVCKNPSTDQRSAYESKENELRKALHAL
ncbi:MAG: hypothetical protein DRQ78_03410 [Epsilonproteobacteria bacterium]|nr:MAG: hypothetical protein DRQ78_03410 [Campylobacterota bacterium]